MTTRALGLLSAIAVCAASSAGLRAPLDAQEPVHLAFGYQCDNRFVLQNEGTSGVDVAYGVVGTPEGGRLRIDPGQTVAIEPREFGDVELLVDDRVVATEPNGRVACAQNVVVMRPLYRREVVTVIRPYEYRRPAYTIAPPRVRIVLPRTIHIGSIFRSFSRPPVWHGQGRDRSDYGNRSARPQDRGRVERPQDRGRVERPQGGNRGERPLAGGRAGRPQNGNGGGRPQNGDGAGRRQNEPRTAHPRGR